MGKFDLQKLEMEETSWVSVIEFVVYADYSIEDNMRVIIHMQRERERE